MTPLELEGLAPERRSEALVSWIRDEASSAEAGRVLVAELAQRLGTPTARSAFLNARGLMRPLTQLARSSSGRTASTLFAWASEAALYHDGLADAPAELSIAAVVADPTNELAWDAFEDGVRSYLPPDLMDKILDDWSSQDAQRALERFERVAKDWDEAERRDLARFREALSKRR